MDAINIFEVASRKALRFESQKGLLSVEDLWDLPLIHKSGASLDQVAKAVNKQLKEQDEESFVNTGSNPHRALLQIKLDIVKHIIATIQAERQAALAREGRRAEKERLLEILANKQEAEMMNMTAEQIQARIAELDAA